MPAVAAAAAEPRRTWLGLWAAMAALVPFTAGYVWILNHFYRHGAYLQDSGLLAYLLTNGDPSLPIPQSLGGASFYEFHISPIFTVFALTAGRLIGSPPHAFAAFMGLSQAMAALAVFWALAGPVRMRPVAAAGLATIFACSGLVIAILRFPHQELFLAAAIMLFLVAFHQRRYGLAAAMMLIALLTREDGGFHIAGLLATVIVARRVLGMRRPDEPAMAWFLAAALLASIAALAIQRVLFPEASSFARIYAGVPAFAHLGWAEVAQRLAGWSIFRAYAVLPMLVAIAWALTKRRPYLLAGYVSVVPWLALQLCALSPLPATLSGYYAFPLLFAGFWTLLGALGDEPKADPLLRREIAIGFGLVLAASFVMLPAQQNPNKTGLIESLAPPPGPAQQRRIEQAAAMIAAQRAKLGNLVVDDGTVSLSLDRFGPQETFYPGTHRRIDTVVFFPGAFRMPEVTAAIAHNGLALRYAISGTPIRIASNRALDLPGVVHLP